jgi:hypothetical protein
VTEICQMLIDREVRLRVHVVSDVHGYADALARAGDGADVLGGLLDFVDYHDHSGGIIGRIFGPEAVRRSRSCAPGTSASFAPSPTRSPAAKQSAFMAPGTAARPAGERGRAASRVRVEDRLSTGPAS